MRLRFKLPAHAWMWSIGITICLLEASGVVAIVRSIPGSHTGSPAAAAESRPTGRSGDGDNLLSGDARANPGEITAAPSRRRRVACPECGTIASIRVVEVTRDVRWQDSVDRRYASDSAKRLAGNGGVAVTTTLPIYEVTVRFRDASTAVFRESGAPTWRVGNRVIVIGGASAGSD